MAALERIGALGARLRRSLVVTCVASSLASVAAAQGEPCHVEDATLGSDSPTNFDRFGSAVAIDGARIAVGAPGDDRAGNDVGSVHVFVEDASGWLLEAVLLPPSSEAGLSFGSAVALEGARLVVGAPGADALDGVDAGTAYVFERGASWQLFQELVPADREAGDLFGASCALANGLAAIGAPGEDEGAPAGGAVYVFARQLVSWNEDAKLVASDAGTLARFGSSVARSGATLLVGADLDPAGGFGAGAAYVFERSVGVWSETAKLVAPQPAAFERFGASVALDGDHALIGAPLRAGGGGEFFARRADVWQHAGTVSPGAVGAGRGRAVALAGQRALVASPGTGALLVLTRDGSRWLERGELAAAVESEGLGAALALSGTRVVRGAPLAGGVAPGGDPLIDRGLVRVARLGNTAAPRGAGSPGTNGIAPALTADGCVGAALTWQLQVTAGLAGAPGFLLVGTDAIALSIAGIELFVGGALLAIGPLTLDGTGAADRVFAWPTPPSLLTLVAQALVMDAGGAAGWSATNALEVRLP